MALNKDRIFKAADKHIRSNRIEKAIGEYETWLKENPKDWNTVRIVGDLYARIGRNDEAIKKYAQVADHYRRDGFNVRAIATHKMILRLDPQNESAMRNLAELQAEEGLLMEAKSHYQTLVELYNKQGHKRLAAEVFKKLAEIDPQDVKIRYKYAEFLNKQGKPDEAAREYVGIADQFIGQGLVEEAVKILEQGRSLTATGPALRVKLAQAHTLQGNHEQAVRMLEEVRSAHPGDPKVLAQLGEAYLAAGNTGEAERVYQQLGDIEPGNPENILRLADLRIAQGKLDAALEQLATLVDRHVSENEGSRAVELLQRILSKDPYHVRTLLKLAEIHTILKQDSGRVAAYDSLCEAYHRMGDFEKAAQVAEQLFELEPESSQHKDRLKFFKSKLAPPAPAPSPPETPAPAPALQMDQDLPELSDVGQDLDDVVSSSFESELTLEEPEATSAPAAPVDLGEVVELTQEDEEHVKEKLTEAEVFVRYGLVDKAIAQLLDVLESFRFHAECREKLIEIYKDQGMNREAAEQLIQLSQVYDKLGRAEKANAAREEASQLNPALAAQAASAELAAQEDLELALAPETESDLDDVGIELDAPALGEEEAEAPEMTDDIPVVLDDAAFAGEPAGAEEEPAIELSFDEGADPGVEEAVEEAASAEIPLEVDLGPDEPDEEIPVSTEDELSEIGELETEGTGAGLGLSDVSEDIEIDLDAPAEDVSFSVDASIEDEEEIALPAEGLEEKIEIPIESENASAPEAPVEAEEFSVEIEEEELAVELPEETPEPEEVAPVSPAAEDASDDVDIDIEIPEEIEVVEEPPAPVSEAKAEPMPPELPARTESPKPTAEPAAAASAPAPPPAPSAPPAASPLAAELQEVDEYIALGLYEDARDTLRELLKHHPGAPGVLAKIEELGFSSEHLQQQAQEPARLDSAPSPPADAPAPPPPGPSSGPLDVPAAPPAELPTEDEAFGIEALVDAPEPAASAAADGGQFVDLASELSDEIFGTQSAVVGEEEEEGEGPLTDPGLDQIFREFRKGVEKQLGTEDYDTRYNLGIAYKEMGLLDEAIAEFQLAAKDEVRGLECCSMLGLCFMEKGMPEIAIKWFSKGLGTPGRREEEYHGLRYDLAQAYEAANQAERALELYMEIYRENARFRDVKDRVRELQAARK